MGWAGVSVDSPDDDSIPWTLRQRRALLVLFSGVLMYLAFLTVTRRAYISDPLPTESSLAAQLADRIDPNTADLATLAAIPNLGEKRAALIIAFREKVALREPGAIAFQSGQDLLKIRGIGLAMVANLSPYLRFPELPTTQPASAL